MSVVPQAMILVTTDRSFRLFVIPVKPAIALLKDIGEAGKLIISQKKWELGL